MTNREPIVFDDITPIEVPVSIAGQAYVLREASGEAARRYNNTRSNCTRFVDGEFAGVSGPIADAEPQLVSDCLYKVIEMPDGKTVHSKVEEKIVKGWPARVQRALFIRAKEISRLDEADGETIGGLEKQIAELQANLERLKAQRDEPKNSQSGTVDGSN